jgi:oxalate decarboxylase/phosphoglucose isomerase-like protein (cupin superfamily)
VADRVEAYILGDEGDEGDERGRAWQVGEGVDFLSAIEDVHLMTLNPGCVRGNHFHRDKREILIVEHEGKWALFWDDGPEEEPRERCFERGGVVAVLVPPGCAHAVENRGGGTMRIVAISDRPYDRSAPDAHRRVLTEED